MMKTIVRYTGYIVSIVLILYIAVMLIAPQQTTRLFGIRTFVVVSTSMEPDINKYDMIVITRAKEDKLEVGDAITFFVHIPELGAKSYVTHYIGDIQVDTSGTTIYKTQGASKDPGDYDNWQDGLGNPYDITFDDIEGEYLFRIPAIGFLIFSLRDPIFIGLLALNAGIVYVLYRYIKGISKDKNNNKKETD